MTSPLRAPAAAGQSIWLDDLHRWLIDSGELAGLIERDGVRKFVEPFEALERWIEHGGSGGATQIAAKRA